MGSVNIRHNPLAPILLVLILVISLVSCATNTVRHPPHKLWGSEWQPIEMDNKEDLINTGIYFQFLKDHKLTGMSGCNQLFGSYKVNENNFGLRQIRFSIFSNNLACNDERKMFYEVEFIKMLEETTYYSYTSEGMKLELYNKDKHKIGILSKSHWWN